MIVVNGKILPRTQREYDQLYHELDIIRGAGPEIIHQHLCPIVTSCLRYFRMEEKLKEMRDNDEPFPDALAVRPAADYRGFRHRV